MPTNNVNAEMARRAKVAAEMVRSEFGRELDFTEPTIGAVEAILNAFWEERANQDVSLPTVSLLFGSYIGEMIRNCFPQATWLDGSNTPNSESPTLRVGDIDLFPLSWCYKRLTHGPAESVVEKYVAFRHAIDSGK